MENFIVTAEGRKVDLQPVPARFIEKQMALVENKFREAGAPVDPPWYWSIEPDENGQGGEKIEWDAASVARDGTEAEKQAWGKHQDAVKRLERAKELRNNELMLLRGLKNEEDRTPTPEWVKEQEYWGVELPTDPQQLALEFIQDQVLKTLGDQVKAISKIALMNMEGIAPEEEVRAAEASFQDAVAQALQFEIRQRLGGLTPRNGSGREQAGSMGPEPEKDASEGGEVLGDSLSK